MEGGGTTVIVWLIDCCSSELDGAGAEADAVVVGEAVGTVVGSVVTGALVGPVVGSVVTGSGSWVGTGCDDVGGGRRSTLGSSVDVGGTVPVPGVVPAIVGSTVDGVVAVVGTGAGTTGADWAGGMGSTGGGGGGRSWLSSVVSRCIQSPSWSRWPASVTDPERSCADWSSSWAPSVSPTASRCSASCSVEAVSIRATVDSACSLKTTCLTLHSGSPGSAW